ncbi:hypothetical protein [Dyadobacter psychrotolerans]|uniref:Uncharacterized protein n=1 Tax=Dyadobacter psychrotolerans TaxID=2541721 RepID=A0A4R5DVL7_9BACT|nr:hypothetical protein [Dyadobacter psychrotolerans]TDE15285.1 hypothetical protein E0F88_12235 [Dyadobacter psychrotolerans]
MSYVTVKTTPTLNAEYFRKAALAYNANTMDRKAWLNVQIINLESALNRYAAQMQGMIEQGAKLDGKSTAASWLSGIGSVATAIPTPYTQIGGAVLQIAGFIVSAAEKKKDSKALVALVGEAREVQAEIIQIKTYYDNYTAEVQKLNLLPLALFGIAAFIIYKQ